MNIGFHLLAVLVLVHSQILPYSLIDLTLLDALNLTSKANDKLNSVFKFILQTHPQLQNYVIVSLLKENNANTTIPEFYILVNNNDRNVMIAVTLSPDSPTFFISYNQINTRPPPNIKTSLSQPNITKSPQATLQTPNKSSYTTNISEQKSYNSYNSLGGYRRLNNLKDDKLRKAVNFLQKLHPNLLNYQLQKAYYQIASGINYLIYYSGVNRMTEVQAKVKMGLDAQLSLLQFNVSCAQLSNSIPVACTTEKALKIYNGCELSIITHPELLDYRLVSIFFEEQTPKSFVFLATFQNQLLSLRAISQISFVNDVGKILSYYSYKYL